MDMGEFEAAVLAAVPGIAAVVPATPAAELAGESLAGMSAHSDDRSAGVAAVCRYTGLDITEADLDRLRVYDV